ncbi:MAG TPA: TIGR03086 family metal-binding protein [Micromonosporaceae bacterium]
MTFAMQRQDYFDAVAWVSTLMATTRMEQLDAQTPCGDFNVRRLMGHLLGTAYRGLATAEGVSTRDIPHVVTDVNDVDLPGRYAAVTTSVCAAWSRLDTNRHVTTPWGPATALEAVRGFTVETVVHGWDLAVATCQPSDAPAGIADRCLTHADSLIPERLRGVMYDVPVVVAQSSSSTDRLAHLLGHTRRVARTTTSDCGGDGSDQAS